MYHASISVHLHIQHLCSVIKALVSITLIPSLFVLSSHPVNILPTVVLTLLNFGILHCFDGVAA
jgi:hypothetical protein